MLSFRINIVKREVAPEGLDLPMYNESEYGLVGTYFDTLYVDSTKVLEGIVDRQIVAANNTVTVTTDNASITFSGWIGFNYTIDKFGYSIDGSNAIMTFDPKSAELAVIAGGGENAARYSVTADISGLDAGLHSFDLLVSINIDGKATTLKLLSFTLEITE